MYSPVRHIPSLLTKRRPIHLTFFITRRCNLNCPFCFYLSQGKGLDEPCDELSRDEIEKVSKSLGNLLWLAFSGGEIFLRQDLVEISKVFYRNNKPAVMLYPTNGMLPEIIRDRTEEILRSCQKSIIVVKLSLDGLTETHDRLRNKKGSFENTLATHRLLKGLLEAYPNFELGINTVFCSENQDEMDDVIEFVNTLEGIKTHTISLIRGSVSDNGLKDVDLLKYHAAVARLEHDLKSTRSKTYRFRGGRIKAAQDIVQRRLIHRTKEESRRLIPCYAGRLNLVLTETGDVYPCEILTESMGNVRTHSYNIEEVLRSDKARRVIGRIMSDGCYCTHECYLMTNILFNPRLYPQVMREYLQIR